ncbi:hypothetical protein [Cohnella sp. JJ-181]|uniref:hypothetical protein n=1 Tax=Cohnella rhizoplanae TaxID=2974897 RepID=UPI0022FF558A|nr:hypothetical protein [Cohnella sp. JJ-181]CAI6025222.1 hypothetical protein COHCIP112018_00477 [Cohnella sp. JJ-181]
MKNDLNVAYIGTVYTHHAHADLSEIKEMGCTSINLCVNETDWYFYRISRREIRRAAQEMGLKVYLNFHGFGSFATTHTGHYYQMHHPESVQISTLGNKGEEVLCCPNNSEFELWLHEKLAEIILDLRPDGVFWDEPGYAIYKAFPDEWGCYCSHCQSKFKAEYQVDMPATLTDEVIAFRQSSLLRFVDGLMRMAKKLQSDIVNVLCLMSFDRNQEGNRRAGWFGVVDWEPFVALESVDVFSTDPYWIHARDWAYFDVNTKEAVELARKYKKSCQIWVQTMYIEPGKEHFIGETVHRAKELGADGIGVWAFRGESGSHLLNWGADPEECWSQVVRVYKELSAKDGRMEGEDRTHSNISIG